MTLEVEEPRLTYLIGKGIIKMPKQDSKVDAKVDCFFGRGGCNRPATFLLLYQKFPFFVKKKIK